MRQWLAVLVVLCFSSACASQQVFKWKDGAGIVHYSQQPPPKGVKNVQMNLSEKGAGENVSESSANPPQKIHDEVALDKASDKQEKHLCSTARQNIELLKSGAMIASGGDIKVATQLKGDQREKALSDARTEAKRYCHAP
ncbi:MAG: DUF4124 domain-containing protein [Pseudomonadota bacterium]|nr:DUF4124 domain-containing protein [Pseudomonadota bacterium]